MFAAEMSEVKALKSALAEAKKEAEEERSARLKHESRVEEVQQELKDAISKCESLERKILDQKSELAKALQSAQEARTDAQNACWEIQEAKKITAGKAFHMRSRFVSDKYILLKEICPRGNNKVVIYISLYHDKCLLFMLEFY